MFSPSKILIELDVCRTISLEIFNYNFKEYFSKINKDKTSYKFLRPKDKDFLCFCKVNCKDCVCQ